MGAIIRIIFAIIGKLFRNMFFVAFLLLVFTILKPYFQVIVYHVMVGPRILLGAFISPTTFDLIGYIFGVSIVIFIVKKFL